VNAITTKLSSQSVSDTVARLLNILNAKGVKLFAGIDQREQAQAAGLGGRETTLGIFGNPAAGTPVMAAAPMAALDLPLKVLVWDDDGQTKVSYTSTAELAARYQLGPELAGNLAAIDALTTALVAQE